MQIISENLKFTYNKKSEFKRQALNGVNLTVNEGDFFGIIGKTGSGKSTFIQHLNGLIKVQQGNLKVGEFDLSYGVKNDAKTLKKLRSTVGMVFQYPEYQLFAESVFEDVAFGLKNFYPELSEQDVEKRVKEALTFVGLNYNEVKDKSPFDLSGGQKRRVAIAGVIITKPKILVLDEPVAGLDPIGKKQLYLLLHDLLKSVVKTIIIVSHDLDEVCENCNKIAVFNDGKVVITGSTKTIFKDKELLSYGLDLSITAKLSDELKSLGVNLDTDYTTQNFIDCVELAYKNRN